MKHILVNGLRLEYLDIAARQGNRPTLLLLHEGLGSVAMWRQFPEKLAAITGCRTIVYSRAGYGGSQPSPHPRTPRYLHREAEENLPALLAALGLDRPVLIGHSDGGSIALIFASAFPAVPLGVAVMAPHEFIEAETLAGIRAARIVWTTTDWPQKLARFHADAEQVFRDWSDTWLKTEFRDWSIEAGLSRIRCPVLAMQGLDDEYATLRQIEAIAEQVPESQLLKLPDCGHSPHRDQEAAVLVALEGFIRNLDRAEPLPRWSSIQP